MSGRWTQFAGYTLPDSLARIPETVQAERLTVKTLGGGFYDPNAGQRASVRYPREVTYSAQFVEASNAALGAQLDIWRGLVGTTDLLWMAPYDTSKADRWCIAKLLDVNDSRAYNLRLHQPVNFVFELQTPWAGASNHGDPVIDSGAYRFASGLYSDLSSPETLNWTPKGFTLLNDGNAPCRSAGITIMAGNSTLTYLKFEGINGHTEFEWSGTLLAHQVLTIDCRTCTTLANGVADYQHIQRTANHHNACLLEIPPTTGETLNVHTNAWAELVVTWSETWL